MQPGNTINFPESIIRNNVTSSILFYRAFNLILLTCQFSPKNWKSIKWKNSTFTLGQLVKKSHSVSILVPYSQFNFIKFNFSINNNFIAFYVEWVILIFVSLLICKCWKAININSYLLFIYSFILQIKQSRNKGNNEVPEYYLVREIGSFILKFNIICCIWDR